MTKLTVKVIKYFLNQHGELKMSDAKLSLLQQFIQQRDAFVQQSGQLSAQFQQVQGAIFACNAMIDKIEADAKAQMEELAKKVQGESNDGDTNGEQAEQTPQE
jgi:hypothetical protein